MSLLIASAVTLAAGLVEGKSVLDHNQKSRSVEYRTPFSSRQVKGGSGSLVVPTIVYGVLSLPLTLIGASPSLKLISKITPVSTSLPQNLEVGPEDISDEPKNRRRRMKIGPKSGIDEHESLIENYNENLLAQKQHLNVQEVREGNRRALAAIRERRLQDKIQSTTSVNPDKIVEDSIAAQSTRKVLSQHQKLKISSYIATLDGRALPTPIAETMRRVRIGLGLYSLITVAVAYQLQSSNDTNENKSKTAEVKHYPTGRNLIAIQNFVKGGRTDHEEGYKSNEGVALRLFKDLEDLKKYSESNRSLSQTKITPEGGRLVLPIVTSNPNHVVDRDTLFWSLGSTESDWDEFPITMKWLFRNDSRHPYILLESNICSSLKDYTRQASLNSMRGEWRTEKEESLVQKSVLEARKIKEITKKKLEATSGESQDLTVFHIIIGNGMAQNSGELEMTDNQNIYIDGIDAVACNIVDQVKLIDSCRRKSLESANEQIESSATEPRQEDHSNFFSITSTPWQTVDTIGKNIRQSVQIFLSHVGGSILSLYSKIHVTQKTTINIFSDDPDIMKWLNNIFVDTKEFKLLFHDCQSYNQKTFYEEEEIFIFLCSTDAATINVASNIMTAQDGPNSSFFIPIIEEEISKETLKLLTKGEIEKCTPICTTSIQEELLILANKLLMEGKATKEIQDMLAYKN